jgi:transporter family-2 protein
MSEQTEPTWLRAAALPGAFVVGVLVTLQSKINGTLAGRIGSGPRAGLAAATVSFGSGLVLLSVLLVLLPSWRRDLGRLRGAVSAGDLPRWQTLGGLLGAALVATQGLSVQTIGVALFVVAAVAGQTSSALLVDHLGLGPAGKAPVTPGRVLGAVLAISAVVISGADSLSGGLLVVVLALLPLLAGGGNAVQQAINAQVGRRSSPWVATWNNFLVGTTGLVVVLLLTLLLPGHIDGLPGDWWLYTGGLIGICFIAGAAALVPTVGVLMFGLATVAGQVLAAVVVDLVTDPSSVTALTYVAAVLTFVGVAVAGISQRRVRQREEGRHDGEPAAA